uniref:Uncharacterized protein n=1 Tax=Triticum urartu TaxID=4572 RepID=A0A8R7JYA4_TRIUA
MKPFEHKSFYGRTFMGFGVLNGISIWLLNQSLCFNSFGFYQGKSSALVGSRFLILHRTRQKASTYSIMCFSIIDGKLTMEAHSLLILFLDWPLRGRPTQTSAGFRCATSIPCVCFPR